MKYYFHAKSTRPGFHFLRKIKNPNPSPIGKKFGFCVCGAPPGTRTLGPLIKRNRNAFFVQPGIQRKSVIFIFIQSSLFYLFLSIASFAPCARLCIQFPALRCAENVQKCAGWFFVRKIGDASQDSIIGDLLQRCPSSRFFHEIKRLRTHQVPAGVKRQKGRPLRLLSPSPKNGHKTGGKSWIKCRDKVYCNQAAEAASSASKLAGERQPRAEWGRMVL